MSDITPAADLTQITEAEREQALAKLKILRPYFDGGISLQKIAKKHGVTLRTLQRWVQRYRKDGLVGLTNRGKPVRQKRQQLSEEIQQLIEGLALQRPQISSAAIFRQVQSFSVQRGISPPSYKYVYRIVKSIDPALLTLAHEGPKVYSEKYELIHRREAERPNAIWQADHTEMDILVFDEKGNARKPWLTIVLDDFSRAIAGYYMTFSAPSALGTSLALRQAIWKKSLPGWHICGIPDVLYTDHGSDFTSRHIEQVTADLKIRMMFSTIGKPRGRGKVERFFATVGQVFLPRLPGYCPGSKTVGKASLTLPQLAQAFESYLLEEYQAAPHTSTGQPPRDRWATGGFLPRLPDSLEQLDLLLMTVAKERKVHPDGVHFMGLRYISPVLAGHVGESVMLRYDPRDMAEIRLFHRDRFLCKAVCHELSAETVTYREIATARNRHRRELRQTLQDRRKTVDSLLQSRRWEPESETPSPPSASKSGPVLKRYFTE
jgi:putative transposase